MKRAVAGCSQMMSMTSSPSKAPWWPRNSFSPSSWSSGTVLVLPVQAAVGPDRVLRGADGVVVGVADGPAGEGPGALPHVVLGVVADAHGEQLQDLPAVVLVHGVLVVVLVVQPEDHRGVPGELDEQVPELAETVPAEHLYLVEDGLGLVELGVAGGEYAVPEQGQLLLQRAAGVDHPVDEVRLAAIDDEQAVLVDVVAADEVFVLERGRHVLGVEQLLDGGFVAHFGVAVQFVGGCAKAGAAQ